MGGGNAGERSSQGGNTRCGTELWMWSEGAREGEGGSEGWRGDGRMGIDGWVESNMEG